MTYFGPLIGQSYPAGSASFTTGTSYLLLNNEVKFDTNIFGFEIYASNTGIVKIGVKQIQLILIVILIDYEFSFYLKFYGFSDCGKPVQCSNYLSKSLTSNTFTSVYSTDINILNLGYNKITFQVPVSIKAGSVMYLTFSTSARVEIETSNIFDYSDYSISYTSPSQFTMSFIQSPAATKFLINTLINSGYYLSIIPIDVIYPIYRTYNFTAKLSNSSIFLHSQFSFSLSKYTFIYRMFQIIY